MKEFKMSIDDVTRAKENVERLRNATTDIMLIYWVLQLV